MKKKTNRIIKPNKLLKSLGGKPVHLALLYNKVLNTNPIITGILLDEDEGHYYLGEGLEITTAIRKNQVQMILDADAHQPQEEIDVPPGSKMQ